MFVLFFTSFEVISHIRLSLKYKINVLNINREETNISEYEYYAKCTFQTHLNIFYGPLAPRLLLFPHLIFFLALCVFFFQLNVHFSKLIPQLFVLFFSHSTEIPLPSSSSKQLTHTISDPKETSKWLYTLYIVHCARKILQESSNV